MPENDGVVAVFAGAFDPITHGHLDIVQRASRLFDHVIVAVGHNPEKTAWFTPEERVEIIREVVAHLPNVSTQSYDGLTMDCVRATGARVLVRGIRDTSDLREELQIANVNQMVGAVETVFFMSGEEHALTSSTLIKQIVDMGGFDRDRLARLVPEAVIRHLAGKLAVASDGSADSA
ncbi:MAG: pantetheine-phosphate adenylyltransferase [Planctomycetota bacterium]|jgi:pantetheine-phosphate adenylyltransferase